MARRILPKLKRRRYSREPKRRFFVFCEGAKTEPSYLAAIKRAYAGALIAVETIAAAGVPYTIAKSAA